MSKKNLNELSKESRVILFLLESKNKNKEEIKKLYLDKYNLSEKSNNINLRVIERVLGSYNKWSSEKKEERIRVLKEELSKVKIDYKEVIDRYKEVKEKVKRSNRLDSFELNLELI
jgi:alkyl sulfatase BDS1-like metallo-beta-lactamase superfamily hydrolase